MAIVVPPPPHALVGVKFTTGQARPVEPVVVDAPAREASAAREADGIVRRSVTRLPDETTWWEERRADSGDGRTREVRRTMRDGEVVAERRRVVLTSGPLVLVEEVNTGYRDGVPVATTIARSASVDGHGKRSSRSAIRYDDDGFATTLVGGAPSSRREPLDAWIEEVLGPVVPGELRPAFGVVRDGGIGRPRGVEVDGPVYVSQPGVRASVEGVDVFLEDESPAASDSATASIAAIRSAWADTPDRMHGAVREMLLLVGRADADRINSAKYGSEFTSIASAGGSTMSWFLGRDPEPEVMRHELAHLTGVGNGAPDEAAWIEAMRADRALGEVVRLGQAGDAITYLTRRTPLLRDAMGVTAYAQSVFAHDGNENEDWAESVALHLMSRQLGGLVRVEGEGERPSTYRFEHLYPARAQILDAYYALAPVRGWNDPGARLDNPGRDDHAFGNTRGRRTGRIAWT